MPYSCVPTESKKQIIRAGDILISSTVSDDEKQWAYSLVTKWRACHAYPINTFQSLLRKKIRQGGYKGEPIVAQRLKRMPTIIDKLKRYPSMNLVTMQDIGGVRAILESINDVQKLKDDYLQCKFAHELVNQYDYINEPRSSDGYRSIHLVYKYKNLLNPNYDGLRLELQIRTRLQHLWATAVETMGTFLGQALKSRQGEQDWLDFFALISCVFAYKEGTSPIPRFSDLSINQIIDSITILNSKINAINKMESLSTAVQFLSGKKKHFYHLIILNSLERKVTIHSFNRDSLNEAMDEYSVFEKMAAEGKQIEPVLVSAGKIDSVKKAYPSFFLDINEFLRIIKDLIREKK